MNYWLILGPIGMIVIGILAVIYWIVKKKCNIKYFLWGGLLWFIAISAKALIDFTIMPSIYTFLTEAIPSLVTLIISIIVGLRTGFFESGISYLIIKKRFKKFKWKDAIALGIGFGAIEAIIFGLLSLSSMFLLMDPGFSSGLTEIELQMVNAYLNQDTLVIFAPWIERVFVLIAHVFATVLVIKAITTKNIKFLWFSIIYKTILDTPVPYFQALIASGGLVATYLIELYIIGMGLLGFFGLKWLKKQKA